jgi:hypothetical protein
MNDVGGMENRCVPESRMGMGMGLDKILYHHRYEFFSGSIFFLCGYGFRQMIPNKFLLIAICSCLIATCWLPLNYKDTLNTECIWPYKILFYG